MTYDVYEVRNNLITACRHLFEQGLPYAFVRHGRYDYDVVEVDRQLKHIATHDLHATWRSSRELQAIIDVAWNRHISKFKAGRARSAAIEREHAALRKLGLR